MKRNLFLIALVISTMLMATLACGGGDGNGDVGDADAAPDNTVTGVITSTVKSFQNGWNTVTQPQPFLDATIGLGQ